MSLLKSANMALSFLLELCMLAALAYWGFQHEALILKIILGVGVPLAVVVIWGVFLAPRSARR